MGIIVKLMSFWVMKNGAETRRLPHRTCTHFSRVLLCTALSVVATNAVGQTYPARPVVLVSPYAAGGPVDQLARVIARNMSSRLNQPVLVENRVGAGASIGANYVAKAEPNGYTLLIGTPASQMITPAMILTPYNGVRDFAFIGMIDTAANVLVVNPKVPAKNLKELIALAKASPDLLSYGTAGVGTSPFMDGEGFKHDAGISMSHIPYKGAAPALNDLIAGVIQVGLSNVSAVLPFIKSGQLRALAYAAKSRASTLPDVPTFVEEGLPDVLSSSWRVLAAPAGTPPAVLDVLSKTLVAIQADPAFQKQLSAQGSDLFVMGPADTKAYMAVEAKRTLQLLGSLKLLAGGANE